MAASFNNNAGDNLGLGVVGGTDNRIGVGESFNVVFDQDVILNSVSFFRNSTAIDVDIYRDNGGSPILLASMSDEAGTFPTIGLSGITLAAGDSLYFEGVDGSSSVDSQSDSALMGITVTAIPEPGSFALLAGLSGLVFVTLRRGRS